MVLRILGIAFVVFMQNPGHWIEYPQGDRFQSTVILFRPDRAYSVYMWSDVVQKVRAICHSRDDEPYTFVSKSPEAAFEVPDAVANLGWCVLYAPKIRALSYGVCSCQEQPCRCLRKDLKYYDH